MKANSFLSVVIFYIFTESRESHQNFLGFQPLIQSLLGGRFPLGHRFILTPGFSLFTNSSLFLNPNRNATARPLTTSFTSTAGTSRPGTTPPLTTLGTTRPGTVLTTARPATIIGITQIFPNGVVPQQFVGLGNQNQIIPGYQPPQQSIYPQLPPGYPWIPNINIPNNQLIGGPVPSAGGQVIFPGGQIAGGVQGFQQQLPQAGGVIFPGPVQHPLLSLGK